MSKEENFLEHNFHDSYLKGVEREDNKTTLIIDTDIYWFPVKPFTLLTLVNADKVTGIKELVGGQKHSSESIKEAKITRSGKDEKNFKLEISFHSGKELDVQFYNFWTERKEKYKDYTNAAFR
ncbi:MAG: hypothetical protein ABEK16_04580 [Candidatus Nanohalobium sp.]